MAIIFWGSDVPAVDRINLQLTPVQFTSCFTRR